MAQKIEFTEHGLNVLSIGSNLNELKDLKVKSYRSHVNKEQIRIWFENEFNYYYVDSDSMFIPQIGLIKELFVVPDKSNHIIGIFIFVENPSDKLRSKIEEAYDNLKLKSDSSTNGGNFRSQLFWKKNDISVFLSHQEGSKYSKISITNTVVGGKSPGVNID